MKRGTKVRVEFTGSLVSKPWESGVRVRVDGLRDWWAVVPVSAVTEISEPPDNEQGEKS